MMMDTIVARKNEENLNKTAVVVELQQKQNVNIALRENNNTIESIHQHHGTKITDDEGSFGNGFTTKNKDFTILQHFYDRLNVFVTGGTGK